MRLLRAFLLTALLVFLSHAEEAAEQDEVPEEGRHALEEEEGEEEAIDLPEESESEAPVDSGDVEAQLMANDKGRACLQHAEELEREVGLFDDKTLPHGSLQTIASRMDRHASNVLGKQSMADFKDKLHDKLKEVHAGEASWGAIDTCMFMLKHHDEL